ncbi:MAG: hypothetical protein ABFD50_07750 [Smithella sp.]
MNPKIITKQIIDFDKAAFDKAFDAITSLQSQSEKMMNLFLERASFLPPEGKRAMKEWMTAYEKNRNDFKESVNQSFKTMEHFLVGSADAAKFSGYAPMKETAKSAEEVTSEFKESIQPEATAVEKAGRQENSLPKMVEETEKQDSVPLPMKAEDSNVLLNTVSARKTVRSGKNKKIN